VNGATSFFGRMLLLLYSPLNLLLWRGPKFLVRLKEGPIMSKCGSSWNLVPLPASSTKGGWEGHAESFGIRIGKRDNLVSYSVLHKKTNNKLVSLYSGSTLVLGQAMSNTDSFDSPQPGLRGSHHLPPHSILCVRPQDLHPNGFLSLGSPKTVPVWTFGTLEAHNS
jgi:hypothetical protein